MTAARAPAELFDDFIKLEWQDIFRKEVDVRLDNGAGYVPNGGSQGVQLLRKNVNAFEEAIRIWSGPSDDPDSGTQGYDRIVDQAGIEYTWEWFLIDPPGRGRARCRRTYSRGYSPTSSGAIVRLWPVQPRPTSPPQRRTRR